MIHQTLYVSRPLLNAHDLIHWAVKQGFPKVLEPKDMHATIAFSKKAVPWDKIKPLNDQLQVIGGHRDLIPLGDKGATVLRFEHPHLHKRWQHFLKTGCSWEHEGYHPHISISYEPHNLNLSEIEPFLEPLIFGPEKFAPVDFNWDQKIKQIKIPIFSEERHKPYKYQTNPNLWRNEYMNESLASLLMKNIDLILEAYNVDNRGNLVEVNKKKVAESDNIFHEYFVKSMNSMFRQINEADPILNPMQGGDQNMHPPGDMHGMHGMGDMPHGMGGGMGGMEDQMDPGMGADPTMGGHPGHMGGGMGDDMMGDMAMNDMHQGADMHPQHPGFNPNAGMSGGGMSGGGGMGGGLGESSEDFDWVFGENTDLEIDSLFNLTEDDDEEKEDDEDEHHLNEFMDEEQDDPDFLPGGGMGGGGGANDFGGDMGGMDDSGMGGEDDMGGMGGGMGDMDHGGGDMMTIHGQTDNGGEFEFSFDKDALDFDSMGDEGGMGGDDMGGDEDGMGGGMGGDEHQFGGGHMGNQPGLGSGEEEDEDQPFHEAAGRKPGKGKRGPKTSRMSIVPSNPAAKHAAPFPTPMGQRNKK